LTLAPAIAAIDEYRRLDLLARSKRQGEKLGARLRDLAARHPSIGDVRGLGLFWAVELVRDRASKKPFNTADDKVARRPIVVEEVTADLMKRGVYAIGWVSHIVLAPPLIIDDAGIDEAASALDASLALADAKM
jgi:taurine--2-oxoglutarate transaminase